MTQITAPLPLDRTILISDRAEPDRHHRGRMSRLGRTIARLGHRLRSALRRLGGAHPLATPSRRAIESTGAPDMTR